MENYLLKKIAYFAPKPLFWGGQGLADAAAVSEKIV
jgi:hypothetical protein